MSGGLRSGSLARCGRASPRFYIQAITPHQDDPRDRLGAGTRHSRVSFDPRLVRESLVLLGFRFAFFRLAGRFDSSCSIFSSRFASSPRPAIGSWLEALQVQHSVGGNFRDGRWVRQAFLIRLLTCTKASGFNCFQLPPASACACLFEAFRGQLQAPTAGRALSWRSFRGLFFLCFPFLYFSFS